MEIRVNLPPTPAGARLLAQKVPVDDFYLLYRKAPAAPGYLFAGLYDPARQYTGDCIAVPFTSGFDSAPTWTAGKTFANVLGSTGDQLKMDGKLTTWKDLCATLGITWSCLAQRDGFFDKETGTALTGLKFACNHLDSDQHVISGMVVGGHVVEGMVPKDPTVDPTAGPAGVPVYSDVFIVPICKHHNSVNAPHPAHPTPGSGNGFFMKLSTTTKVIKLKNYMELPAPGR